MIDLGFGFFGSMYVFSWSADAVCRRLRSRLHDIAVRLGAGPVERGWGCAETGGLTHVALEEDRYRQLLAQLRLETCH